MVQIKHVIEEQIQKLPCSQRWWPIYLYHFTDIQNALGIIEEEWIFSRQSAIDRNSMKNDNASTAVLNVSQNRIIEYARLYFRPKTPTQYHNEGYKPKGVRAEGLDASCPIPIFFFLDAMVILRMDGVYFSEKSCAGRSELQLMAGAEKFSKLPFHLIYHNEPFNSEERDSIIQHRQAEVVRKGGIPIESALKGIVCRSVAERQTLLYMLKTKHPRKYEKYKTIIQYNPELDVFFNNGFFIKNVEYNSKGLIMEFNDPAGRYNRRLDIPVDVRMHIKYLDDLDNIIGVEEYYGEANYANTSEMYLQGHKYLSNRAKITIYFDSILMYENVLYMQENIML